jgi:hypothetical protein
MHNPFTQSTACRFLVNQIKIAVTYEPSVDGSNKGHWNACLVGITASKIAGKQLHVDQRTRSVFPS